MLAATLTLVAIFAPVIFMKGIIGSFFQSFAVVVTVGVLVSLFVSLTLTPVLCARYLGFSSEHGRVYRVIEARFRAMDQAYRRLIAISLGRRWFVILVAMLIVLASGFIFMKIDKGFMPEEDEGRFIVALKTPLGSSIEYTELKIRAVEAIFSDYPEIIGSFATIGQDQARQVSQANIIANMADWQDRDISQVQLMETLRQRFSELPGVEVYVTEMPMVGGPAGRSPAICPARPGPGPGCGTGRGFAAEAQ